MAKVKGKEKRYLGRKLFCALMVLCMIIPLFAAALG